MAVDLLSIGRSGLMSAKKSLQTTGHNIANSNTEGFSRQRVTQETNIPIGEGNIVIGSGSRVRDVKRIHDELIEKRVQFSVSQHKFNEERVTQLMQVEDIFNEVSSDGINKIMNRFFNSFRELSNQPENETVRSIVRDNAKLVVNDFRRARESLQSIANNIDTKVATSVEDINFLLKSISRLNLKITEIEATNGETGDLRDQRDLAITKLSEFMNVSTFSDEKNQFVVNADGVGSLVAGEKVQELMANTVVPEGGNSNDPGRVEVFFKERPGSLVTNNLKGGTLGAMIKTRNTEIEGMQDNLDELAFELANTVNAIHRRGHTNQTIPQDAPGGALAGTYTGIDFFKVPLNKKRAAEYLDLSSAIKEDVNNIVTALDPNAPGDNRVAIAISKLQYEKVLGKGTSTFEDQFLKSVGQIGLVAGKAKVDADQSEGILAQVKSIRERISGVSLDEETSSMVRFQQSYDASAKVLKVADEMFKTVLGIRA